MLSSTLGTTVYAPNKLSAIIADILKSSTFFAPLTHSLALTRGSGSATFTRATTATVFDNEGKLITVPSGASRHVGARYVRNLLTATEFSAGVTDAPSRAGLLSSTTLSGFAGALAFGYDGVTTTYAYKTTGVVANVVNVFSVYVEMTDGNSPVFGHASVSNALNDFAIVIGGAAPSPLIYSVSNISGSLYRVSAAYTPNTTGNIGVIKYSTNSARTFKVTGYQLENVTGQADQTASEYVSVGVPIPFGTPVLSDDFSDNDASDWAVINSATVSASTGSLVITNNGATAGAATKAMTLVAGKTYVITANITYGGAGYARVEASSSSVSAGGSMINVQASGTYTYTFTATATTMYLIAGNRNDSGVTNTFDNITVTETIYHGLGVDGIKAFPTHKSGAPISASSLEGYLSEPAATNNLLYCRDLLAGAKVGAWIPSTTGAAIISEDFTSGLGTFTNTSTGTGTVSVSGGQVSITGVDVNNRGKISSTFVVVPNEPCVLSFSVVSGTTSFQTNISGANFDVFGATSPGQKIYTFVPTTSVITLVHNVYGAGTVVLDNVTVYAAALKPTLTATGIDGATNSATTLTAAADNATILQPRTLASAARSSGAYVKRRTGTGNVYFTRDGGTTWTDITASLSTSAWYRAKIENSSVTNPSVGFKLATSGDAIDVDYVQDEANPFATSPITTTTATVTRNGDLLSYQSSGNVDANSTLFYLESKYDSVALNYYLLASYTDANNFLGIYMTTVNRPAFVKRVSAVSTYGIPIHGIRQSFKTIGGWSSTKMRAASYGVIGSIQDATTSDAVFAANINIGSLTTANQPAMPIKNLHTFTGSISESITDSQMKAITQ